MMEQNPDLSSLARAQLSLGVLTAACSTVDEDRQSECKTVLKPLEENKESPVDTLTNMIVEFGEESLDRVVDGFNLLIMEATAKAKDRLIAEGKLNKDGTPIVETP